MIDTRRVKALGLLFGCLILLILTRLFYLQVVQHRKFLTMADEQHRRQIDLPAQRGDISDRNGEILASTIDTYTVFMSKDGKFSYLKKRVPQAEAKTIKATDPEHIGYIPDKKRIYPENNLAAQLIGFVGEDNEGLSGVELSYNEYLAGKKGEVKTEGDPQGRELYGAVRVIERGEEGLNLTLTIDNNIQFVAERAIAAQIKRSSAASGTLIVMNARTGEILALASKPDFNPNNYRQANGKLWHPRFLDPYEPGSTFKLITAASGLEEGVINLATKLQALPQIVIGGRKIENSHQIHWPGKEISLSFALEQSINTAMVQIGLKLGPERFYRRIKAFGFGSRIGIGLAGESKGILRDWHDWYKSDLGMITFGQSIAVTPFQLMSAVSAFANEGRMVKPFLVKKIESGDGSFVKVFTAEDRGRAVSPKVAGELKELMRNVVVRGSGRRASIEGFAVGGKTGTAQKTGRGGGYLKGHYIASFIGFAPLQRPEILALVIVDDPKGSIWGESVCGPVFKEVVEYSLRYLNAKPDMI